MEAECLAGARLLVNGDKMLQMLLLLLQSNVLHEKSQRCVYFSVHYMSKVMGTVNLDSVARVEVEF